MVLYEAATGYPPDRFPGVPQEWFADEADAGTLEFHEVVLRACEGAKDRRYANAEEVQADLALLQSGQSVRRLRALERRARVWRRLGWGAGITVAVAVATSVFANWRVRGTRPDGAPRKRTCASRRSPRWPGRRRPSATPASSSAPRFSNRPEPWC